MALSNYPNGAHSWVCANSDVVIDGDNNTPGKQASKSCDWKAEIERYSRRKCDNIGQEMECGRKSGSRIDGVNTYERVSGGQNTAAQERMVSHHIGVGCCSIDFGRDGVQIINNEEGE